MLLRKFAYVIAVSVVIGGLILSCTVPVVPIQSDESTLAGGPGNTGSQLQISKDMLASEDDPVWHSIVNDEENYAPDEVLLAFRDGVVARDDKGEPILSGGMSGTSFLSENGLKINEVIYAGDDFAFEMGITDGTPVMDKVEELKSHPDVRVVEPNYKVYFCEAPYVPNDPMWEYGGDADNDPKTSVYEQFGPSKIGADIVWNETKGRPDVVVAVIDTGVRISHQDLNSVMWTNDDEIPGNGIDDDENMYIDDIHGWDFLSQDPDIMDSGNHHGTACSGVVAAAQDNGLGCTGVAPGIKIMGLKVDLSGGGGYAGTVVQATYYAANNDADFMSMSFRSYVEVELMHEAMDYAAANGTLPIGAAGNEDSSNPCWPGSWDSVVRVGATIPFTGGGSYPPRDEVRISRSNGDWWGSSFGPDLDCMGFGEYYITTNGGSDSHYYTGGNNGFNGTSCATPMVAGAFAMLKSFYPWESVDWYRDRMNMTADDLNEPGYDINSGWGRVNLLRACYGSDRYEAEEDTFGFVSLNDHDNHVFDSIHNVEYGTFADVEDLYKYRATADKYLLVDLDIFTWGENLDLEIYSEPSLKPQFLLDQQTGENHAGSSFERTGILVQAGNTYYFRIIPGGLGDSTSYGLSVTTVDNSIDLVNYGSYSPGVIHSGQSGVLTGYVDLDSAYIVNIENMNVTLEGTMPGSRVTALHLYRDNGNKSYGAGDTEVGTAPGTGSNRFRFTDMAGEVNVSSAPQRFFITADLSGITTDAEFSLSLQSYKDITTSEGLVVPYDRFPVVFDPVTVAP